MMPMDTVHRGEDHSDEWESHVRECCGNGVDDAGGRVGVRRGGLRADDDADNGAPVKRTGDMVGVSGKEERI